jgi:hypothetical protein
VADDDFAVDIDALEKGGVRIKDMADIVNRIKSNLLSVSPLDGFDGPSDIEKSLQVNYKPSAQGTLDFFDGLSDLVDAHGDKVLDLTNLVRTTDDTATTVAGGDGGGGGKKG